MATDFSLPVFVITDVTISGIPYKLPIFQTGKVVKVKLAVAPLTEYVGTEEGATGIYKFTGVEDGKYHKLVDGVQSGTFGVNNGRFIADDDMSKYAKVAGGNNFTGTQAFADAVNFAGAVDHDGGVNIDNDLVVNEAFIDAASVPFTTNTPTFGSTLVWRDWVLSQIAAIVVVPYQESVNKRRCLVGGYTEANKVYTSPKACSASFGAPSATFPCIVTVEGTGISTQYVNFDLNTLRDYVHWTSAGKHIGCIIRDGSANAKICTFKNCTLFFGANDFGVDRIYANKRFEDCDIYCYKNMTFNNCELIRCRVFHAGDFKAYIAGASKVEFCGFNNDPAYDLVGGYEIGTYNIPISAMPADPSTPEIPNEE